MAVIGIHYLHHNIMKNLYYSAMAVMLAVMAGCQKDYESANVQTGAAKTFYATFENGAETRTALDADNNVLWSAGDQISVFAGNTANSSYILNTGENTTYGEFKLNSLYAGTESNGSESALSANVAYYPYDSNVTVSENNGSYTFNATFPAAQTYAESGTFGNGASPMVAVTSSTSDDELKFKNVGAVFRLQLKGDAAITKVVFSADAYLAGDCEISASYSAVPAVSVAEGSNTIVLDCGEGVQLDAETTADFIVAMLPVESITGGITVTIYDNAGKKMVYAHKADEIITIKRSKAYTTPEVTYIGDQDADTAASVQAALDAATDGTTIQLEPGVDYGTLYIRPVLNAAHTESGDWFTSNYRTELCRKVENLTILGASGAKVDAIEVVAGYKGSDYIAVAPDLMCYADINNLVIDGVEFTGASDKEPVYIPLMNINLDGLTVRNCKMADNTNANLVYIYGTQGNHTFATASKNVAIENNTVDGVKRLCELRETENVTITGNTIKNTDEHAVLLTVNSGASYSGNVTVTGNNADGINDRFVRMAGAGDATVTIKGNVIANYKGKDYDYIKVTDSNGIPVIENNTCAYTVSTADALKTALKANSDGARITLAAGTYSDLSFTDPANYHAKNVTIIGEDGAAIDGFSVNSWTTESNIEIDGLTFKNVTFAKGLLLSTKVMSDVTVESCKFVDDACIHQNDKTEKLTGLRVVDSGFTGDLSGTTTALMLENVEDVTVTGSTFTNIDFNVLQSNILSGTVLFDDNIINGTGDRVFRFVEFSTDTDVTISNNTITSEGDDDNELAKSTNPVEITLTNNTWNGKTDAEVADKLINITAK